MSDKEKPSADAQLDLSKVPFRVILSGLTAPHIVGIITVGVSLITAILFFAPVLDPRVISLRDENARLQSMVNATEIVDGKARVFPLDKFIVGPDSDTAKLNPYFEDKLFIPPLSKGWAPFAANDLTLLAKIMGEDEMDMRLALPATFAFNQQNPPKIWVMPGMKDLRGREWIPYIQISLISRERAQDLMKSINKDGNFIFDQALNHTTEILKNEFSDKDVDLIMRRIRGTMNPTDFAEIFFNGAFSEKELVHIFGRTLNEQQREAKIDALARRIYEQIAHQFSIPTVLVENGMGSLTNVTPETGLLLGRLLFYVFGVSPIGRVDIQQLVLGYSGSYAQLRRSVEIADVGNKPQTVYVYDNVLILATKSDFCLIHIRVPEFNNELKNADNDARAWLRQIRMREFR